MVKARGMELRRFVMGRSVSEGNASWMKSPLVISERKTSRPPRRKKISPLAKREIEQDADGLLKSSFEIEALELKDMPYDFDLLLENNSLIRIRKHRSIMARIMKAAGDAARDTVMEFLAMPPQRRITIEMPEAEARALYWVAAEKTPVIVLARTPVN